MMRRIMFGVLLVCAGRGIWAADMVSAPVAPVSAQPPAVVAPIADEALLRERVLARWQALIKRDIEAAYQFETPAYRAIYTPTQLGFWYGTQLAWRMANVKNILYDDPVMAKVQVEVEYQYADSSRGGKVPEVMNLTQEVQETWLRKDGQWWHQRD